MFWSPPLPFMYKLLAVLCSWSMEMIEGGWTLRVPPHGMEAPSDDVWEKLY